MRSCQNCSWPQILDYLDPILWTMLTFMHSFEHVLVVTDSQKMRVYLTSECCKLVPDSVMLDAKHTSTHNLQPFAHENLEELLYNAGVLTHGLHNARLVHRVDILPAREHLLTRIHQTDEVWPVVLSTRQGKRKLGGPFP